MPCSPGEIKRKAHVRTTYGGVNLCRPIKVPSTCVKPPTGEKKEKNVCSRGDIINRKSYEKKQYAGVVLCKPIAVSASCSTPKRKNKKQD